MERARWWWRKNERGRTKINRDAVDVAFKLRSPPKITLDIGACQSDNKIKSIIIFEIFYDF